MLCQKHAQNNSGIIYVTLLKVQVHIAPTLFVTVSERGEFESCGSLDIFRLLLTSAIFVIETRLQCLIVSLIAITSQITATCRKVRVYPSVISIGNNMISSASWW